MKQDVKVSFYLKKDEKKKDGKCPLMARLSVGRFSKLKFSMQMTVPESLWGSGRATGKSLTAIEINKKLDETRASALSHYRELSAVREHVTAEEVKNLLLGMACGQETLLAWFRAHNVNFDKRVGVNRSKGAARSYWCALDHLAKFLKEKYNLSDIPFTALDRSFIEKYDLHLRIDCKLSLGTIVLQTTRLCTIIGYSIAEGILSRNPFAGYAPEQPLSERDLKSNRENRRNVPTVFYVAPAA